MCKGIHLRKKRVASHRSNKLCAAGVDLQKDNHHLKYKKHKISVLSESHFEILKGYLFFTFVMFRDREAYIYDLVIVFLSVLPSVFLALLSVTCPSMSVCPFSSVSICPARPSVRHNTPF